LLNLVIRRRKITLKSLEGKAHMALVPRMGTIKMMVEPAAGFAVTDAIAGYINSRIFKVQNNVIVPTSKYSRVGAGIATIAYAIGSYMLAKYALETSNADASYLSIGASSSLLLQTIEGAVATALMGKTLSPTAAKLVNFFSQVTATNVW